jgi:hypothetical protein
MSQGDEVIPRRLLVHSVQTYAAAGAAVKLGAHKATRPEMQEQLIGCANARTGAICIQEVAYEHID